MAAPLQNTGIDQGWMKTVVPSGVVGLTQQTENNTGQHCSRFVPFCPALSTRHSRSATAGSSALLSSFAGGSSLALHSLPLAAALPRYRCSTPPDPPVFFTAPPRTAYVFPFFSRGLKGENRDRLQRLFQKERQRSPTLLNAFVIY